MLNEYWCCHLYVKWVVNHDIHSALSWVLPVPHSGQLPNEWSWHPRWKLFHYVLNELMNYWVTVLSSGVSVPLPGDRICLLMCGWIFFSWIFFVRTLCIVTLDVPDVSRTLMYTGIPVCMSFQNADPRPHCQGWRNAFHKSFFFLFLLIDFIF